MPLLVDFDTVALLAGLRRLLECESPSSDAEAVARSADEVTSLGIELLGDEPERIVIDGTTHLRWRFGARTEVLVLTHHDTVWPLGSLAVHPVEVNAGVLTGPGCFDMKAGVVMAMHAIAALPARDGVCLLVTGDEEVGSPSSRELIEAEASGARAALVTEASAPGGALKTERKGVSWYELRVNGRAAHAGLDPERGVNATVELAHQVLAASALGDAAAGTTVTPTLADSGTAGNTVPAAASVYIDVRARTTAEQLRVDAAIRALKPVLPGAELVVLGGPNRRPLEREASHGLFERATVLGAQLGLEPFEGVAVGGGSDGNLTAGMGVPTLDGLGAVGGGAHAADEHVIVAQLAPRTALLSALIADLLAEEVA
ncbi:M20/M25/M40 family metallo-hydrolase [Agromyces neolithicus]|uniref:M20 family metallopeptidase n=1 Tax=Agromyces neolithicus TaxID=269420 RepID=A0ABN2M993_9MICO